MTFLPIVERELRRAARRPGTYWLRAGAALAGIATGFALMVFNTRGTQSHELAQTMFIALGVVALGFCLLAGVFLTADCLSAEKREGTLGLLFLTDLKGYDVVLGKLAATSLHSVYGLLAIFPVLALPLLMGGVTGGELGRLILVLLVTLFLSLATGMAVSALSREARQAMLATFGVLVLLAGVIPAVWRLEEVFFRAHPVGALGLYLSPGFALFRSLDIGYRAAHGAREFWTAFGALSAMGVALLAGACLLLPRAWQEKPIASGRSAWHLWRFGRWPSPAGRRALLEANAVEWLARRDRQPQVLAWALIGFLSVLFLGFCAGTMGKTGRANEASSVCIFLAYGIHVAFKCLMAVEAGRRVSEDFHSGALELLAVAPLRADTFIRGQLSGLQAQFRQQRLLVALVNAVLAWLILFPDPVRMNGDLEFIFLLVLAGGVGLLYLDSYALSCVGLRQALRGLRPHRVVLATVGRVLLPPWVFLFITPLLGAMSAKEHCLLWFVGCAMFDLALVITAKAELAVGFRQLIARAQFGDRPQLTNPEPLGQETLNFEP